MRKEYLERLYQESLPENEGVQTEEMEENKIDFMRDIRENIVKESDIEIVEDLNLYTHSK